MKPSVNTLYPPHFLCPIQMYALVGEAACGVWDACRFEPQPCLRPYPRRPRPPLIDPGRLTCHVSVAIDSAHAVTHTSMKSFSSAARASTFGRPASASTRNPKIPAASTSAARGSSGSRRQSRRSHASWWHRAAGSAATPCRATRGTRAIRTRPWSSRTCFGVEGTVGRRRGEAAAPRSLGAPAEIRASVQSSPEADGAIRRDCAGGARELQRRYRWAEPFQRASSAQVPAVPTQRICTAETHRCNSPRRTTTARAAAAPKTSAGGTAP
eukprot:scaffold110121_cov36-Phaeocystis_antarctica.AAC.2